MMMHVTSLKRAIEIRGTAAAQDLDRMEVYMRELGSSVDYKTLEILRVRVSAACAIIINGDESQRIRESEFLERSFEMAKTLASPEIAGQMREVVATYPCLPDMAQRLAGYVGEAVAQN